MDLTPMITTMDLCEIEYDTVSYECLSIQMRVELNKFQLAQDTPRLPHCHQ